MLSPFRYDLAGLGHAKACRAAGAKLLIDAARQNHPSLRERAEALGNLLKDSF